MSRQTLFQASQVGLLAFLVAMILLLRRRGVQGAAGLSEEDMRRARARIEEIMRQNVAGEGRGKGAAQPSTAPSPALVTSALPTWDHRTPPHRMLGVPQDAKPEVVDAAYKALFRKYHPDRFASWGPDYQARAHEVVTLLQAARDKMKAS